MATAIGGLLERATSLEKIFCDSAKASCIRVAYHRRDRTELDRSVYNFGCRWIDAQLGDAVGCGVQFLDYFVWHFLLPVYTYIIPDFHAADKFNG
jgi:hypothetical protein|tara:strand:- start:2504 stop:2788 length:285 start_codon:yes stop_codon:yes gene_type:complete